MEIAETLANNYVFKGLTPEQLKGIAGVTLVREYLGGDTLVRQFDKSSDVLILLEGNAISKTFSGEIVAKFGPGSVIGEVALIDGQPRSANVVSVGTSKAAVIPAKAINDLMESDPAIGYRVLRNITELLCRRLRSMNDYADTLQPSREAAVKLR